MRFEQEVPVIFENGVFKPEPRIDLPDHARFMITIRDASVDDAAADAAQQAIEEIRARGLIRLDGWTFDRDELYERD